MENSPVNITDKMVVTVSTQKGCPMSCNFCDCPKVGFKGNATLAELLSEITTAISMSGLEKGKRLNVHYARMGEPSFNFNGFAFSIVSTSVTIKACMNTRCFIKIISK